MSKSTTFQQRVREEKSNLDENLDKLRLFIAQGSEKFEALPLIDRQRLIRQESAMSVYSGILGERIDNFSDDKK